VSSVRLIVIVCPITVIQNILRSGKTNAFGPDSVCGFVVASTSPGKLPAVSSLPSRGMIVRCRPRSNPYLLDLIKRELIAGAVIELGRAG
jgi:hypothetical protein